MGKRTEEGEEEEEEEEEEEAKLKEGEYMETFVEEGEEGASCEEIR